MEDNIHPVFKDTLDQFFGTNKDEAIYFPARYQIGQDVTLSFSKSGVNVERAKICGVHFYEGKVKYDLAMKLDNDESTRVYNVDSCFVYPG